MDTVLNELMSVGIHECCVMLVGCRTGVCVSVSAFRACYFH